LQRASSPVTAGVAPERTARKANGSRGNGSACPTDRCRIDSASAEAKAFGDLARQQIASHVPRVATDVTRLELASANWGDMGENAGGGAELQKRNVFCRNRAGGVAALR
jgi:hypothetical protein